MLLDNIGALETLLSERAGHTVRLPVTQTKGPAISGEALGTAEREILRNYYRLSGTFEGTGPGGGKGPR